MKKRGSRILALGMLVALLMQCMLVPMASAKETGSITFGEPADTAWGWRRIGRGSSG